MEDEGNFFLQVEFWLIRVEEMELENHHLAIVTVDSSMHHKWMLKLVGAGLSS